MRTLILLCVVATCYAQYEKGHVKILQDKRYQDGGTFGNFRDQEDGTKYFEETGPDGVRRGYWEYKSQSGQILRTEFEAGPGIGFRITKSNHHDATPVVAPQPQFQPIPVARAPSPPSPPQPQTHNPAPVAPIPQEPRFRPTPLPAFQALFDYPGNLEFSRTHSGHHTKFTAL